eukprot:Nk52_evm37s1073 gene=Nk52_evmTU37s1073
MGDMMQGISGVQGPGSPPVAKRVDVLEDPVKPVSDENEYRNIVLENGLRVLLVHNAKATGPGGEDEEEEESGDEESECGSTSSAGSERVSMKATSKSAAALCVNVGCFSDPDCCQGLAHFLEHMLFMGSDKYPDENGFDSFISKHGGDTNASTDCEYTIYQFAVGKSHFREALDMFAHFFISPLMKADAVERELQAVDSEFDMAKQSDSCRRETMASLCAIDRVMFESGTHNAGEGCHIHPCGKFGYGNIKSLKELPEKQGINVRDRLWKLYQQFYFASNMTLTIMGWEDLDTLQYYAMQCFSAIPVRSYAPPVFGGFDNFRNVIKSPLKEIGMQSDSYTKAVRESLKDFEHTRLTSRYLVNDCTSTVKSFNAKNLGPQHVHFPLDFVYPFDLSKWNRMYYMYPVKYTNVLQLSWVLPCMHMLYKSKPWQYIGELLGHEGPGSILMYLKEKGWATGVYAGNGGEGFEASSFGYIFELSITLTNEGLENYLECINIVFIYIDMIVKKGPQIKFWEEQKDVYNMAFNYREQSEPIDYCEELCYALHMYPPRDVLRGSIDLVKFDPAMISYLLSLLTPQLLRIVVSSKKFEDVCTEREEWVDVKYSSRPFNEADIIRWSNAKGSSIPKLSFPEPNPFIATEFSLKPDEQVPFTYVSTVPAPENIAVLEGSALSIAGDSIQHPLMNHAEEFPCLILSGSMGHLFFKRDKQFRTPKACLLCEFHNPFINESVENCVMTELFSVIHNHLLKKYAYAAEIAELNFTLDRAHTSLILRLSGFDQKLAIFMEKIVEGLSEFGKMVNRKVFDMSVEQLCKIYNTRQMKPGNVAREARLLLLQEVKYSSKDKADIIRSISLDKLKSFISKLIKGMFVDMLICGNMKTSECQSIFENTCVALNGKKEVEKMKVNCVGDVPALHKPHIENPAFRERIRCVPNVAMDSQEGIVIELPNLNDEDENGVVENYYQGGIETVASKALVEFLEDIMFERCFDVLRTKEQLGYHVSCSHRSTNGVLGFTVKVVFQLTKFSHEYVNERIEIFLEEFFHDFLLSDKGMSDLDFKSNVFALVNEKLKPDNNMSEEMDRYAMEIGDRKYMFDRHLGETGFLLGSLTKKHVIEWMDQHILNSRTRRKLSLRVGESRAGCRKESSTESIVSSITSSGTRQKVPTVARSLKDVKAIRENLCFITKGN